MPDADELEGARQLALLACAKLSKYGLGPSSSSPAPSADLPPLLNCCFQLLRRLDHADPDLAGRCASHLRAFIDSVLSRDPDPSFVPALEVLVENLVDGNQLRRIYTMIDDDDIQRGARISTMSKSFQHELCVRLELMSHHFITSEVEFEQIFSWSEKATQRVPELGLAAAISLVRGSYSFSMPAIAQAHLVLLVSICVANGDLDLHLQVFQHTMSAYLMNLPALGVLDRNNAVETPFSCYVSRRFPNSCVPDATNQKLNCQISKLLSCCKAHFDDGLHLEERDAFDICMSFIEENQHLFPEQLRQEAVIVVKRIVSNSLGCAKQKETHGLDAKVSEEVIYIAAVLRLMGSSFLEILHCLRKLRVQDDWQRENHVVLCISESIRLLGQYEANGLNKHDLFGMPENAVDLERSSMLMLFHFASLLVFCLRKGVPSAESSHTLWGLERVFLGSLSLTFYYARRLIRNQDLQDTSGDALPLRQARPSVFCLRTRFFFGFLWKGCIIMIMMAMNLVSDEERSLSAFQVLIASEDSATSSIHQEDSLKGSVRRKSSTSIASQFNNLRKLRVQGDSSLGTPQRCKSGDGRAFLETIPGYKQNSSEWEGLEDFVECEDVDYLSWWMQRMKFKKYMGAKRKRSKRPSEYVSKIKEYSANKTKRRKTSR